MLKMKILFFLKGQSKRIWAELYKVIDASDVVIQVLDARDPQGTRSKSIESYIKHEKKHKHFLFILNKCDLVPTWATSRWVKILSQEYPTLAFHASITNPFGKGSLIQLLRQFGQLHNDKKNISVGFIGYPNVGKSSIINTLRKKKVCKTAPIPGETKVWHYVNLMRKIFLIDCPGVVPASAQDSPVDKVLKSVVRIENISELHIYVEVILNRVKKQYIQRHYKIIEWKDHLDFLQQLAMKSGKYLQNGVPDVETASKRIIFDWQRGKIPWFVVPPFENENDKIIQKNTPVKNIHQLFNKIKLSDDFKFNKDDKIGTSYGYEDQTIPETTETTETTTTNNNNNDEVMEEAIDFDEIYSTIPKEKEEEKEEESNKKKKKKRIVNGYIPQKILRLIKKKEN